MLEVQGWTSPPAWPCTQLSYASRACIEFGEALVAHLGGGLALRGKAWLLGGFGALLARRPTTFLFFPTDVYLQ